MTYFFDRNLGRKIPHELSLRGIDAVAHDDHFDQDTPDDTWLAEVGGRGWTVITKDDRIRFNAAERSALITYGVGCFAIMRRNATRQELLEILDTAWHTIEAISTSEARPFLYAVYKDGSVRKRDLEGFTA